ncbi:MAG: hypothetical protein JWM85_1270, partial [Acidimicrobiaceae bacterium]|nr:hypothetical protein [Acidimicrobiaceae bacterium]
TAPVEAGHAPVFSDEPVRAQEPEPNEIAGGADQPLAARRTNAPWYETSPPAPTDLAAPSWGFVGGGSGRPQELLLVPEPEPFLYSSTFAELSSDPRSLEQTITGSGEPATLDTSEEPRHEARSTRRLRRRTRTSHDD